MSIAGITSNPWTTPYPYPSQGGLGSTTPGATPLSAPQMFQKLAADVQALLLQSPSAAAPASATGSGASSTDSATGSGVATSAAAGTATVTPEQQLATDLQSFFTQLESIQPGSNPNAQSGTTTQTAATGQAQRHHHHHHDHYRQSGGSSADTNTSGGTTASSSASTSQSSTASGDQSVEALAASIVQAIQAYGSQNPATATTSLTA
jgi:hypothetical protein